MQRWRTITGGLGESLLNKIGNGNKGIGPELPLFSAGKTNVVSSESSYFEDALEKMI